MSNPTAVAAVTATVITMVQAAVDGLDIAPRPVAAAGDLDDTGDNARVFVHLLRISRNQGLATADLPTRSVDGSLRSRPCAVLDLHYLIAFRGVTTHETQLMLAGAAAALHGSPHLTGDWLAAALAAHPEIAGHDLLGAERVRLTPEPMTVDELTRVWALYSPGSFCPTLAVAAGPILVEAGGEPGAVLPVRSVGLGAQPLRVLRVDSVSGPDGPGAPVRAADPMPDLQVLGVGLLPADDDTLEVLVDVTTIPHTVVDDAHLLLPAAAILPGRHLLRVRRMSPPIAPVSGTRRTQLSDPVPLVVTPTLGSVTPTTAAGSASGLRSGKVRVGMTPSLHRESTTRLLLDSQTLDPPVSLALPPDLPGGAGPFAKVDYTVDDAPAGTYRVTLEVDGARSLPPVDGAGHFVLTTVTL